MSNFHVGKSFLKNLKTYLGTVGLSQEKINKINEKDIQSIFTRADIADGKQDGKVTGENFLSILKGEYKDENINIDALSQEYLDAWQALAGDDNILEEAEVAIDEEVSETPSGGGSTPPSTPSITPSPDPTDTTNTPPEITEVTAESLEGKDSSTLRSERTDVINQLDSLRTEMTTAEEAKKGEVATKKEAYDKLLEDLAKVSETKNEDGKTLKDLESDKKAQEDIITAKEDDINTVKSDINTSKDNITAIQGKINDLKEPDRSQFTTKNEKNESVFDEAGYNAALAQYRADKANLEADLRAEEDNLSELENKLSEEEENLNGLEEGLTKINSDIDSLVKVIAKKEENNSELAGKVSTALSEYQTAQQELATIREPYETKIATLNKNLSAYDTAIKTAEEKERTAKEEFTSEIKDENALEYKSQIDELFPSDDEKETESEDKTDGDEESEKTTQTDDPDKNKALKEILEKAMMDENIPVAERMKLLSYARGKNENTVREMLKDDTFFVKAYAAMANDDSVSTETVLAMQDVYFDIQGNNEISLIKSGNITSTNPFTDEESIEETYTKANISLLGKAIKNGNTDKVIKNFERNGISIESLKDAITNSTEYSDEQKNELLKGLGYNTTKTYGDHTVEKLEYGSLEAEISYPKDLKEGDEVPILIFFSGSKQNVAYRGKGDNSRYLMYDPDTTPLGNMYNPNTTWASNQRVINPEYNYNLNSFPGIIIEFSSDKDPSVKDLQGFLDSLETNGINGTKVKRGKTVVAGASAGTGPAYTAAKGLGSKYVDEFIPISGSMRAEQIEGVDTYAYEYASYKNGKLAHSTMQKVCEQMGIPQNYFVVESKEENGKIVEKVSHNNMIRLMFTKDSDGDGNCDFFQKHFAKYYQ